VEVAQRRAVLDVHQHALGPCQGGECDRLVVGQAGNPEGAQRGQIGPARKEVAQSIEITTPNNLVFIMNLQYG
jgi:hypothetical protein